MVHWRTAHKTRSLDFASAPEYTNRHVTEPTAGACPPGGLLSGRSLRHVATFPRASRYRR